MDKTKIIAAVVLIIGIVVLFGIFGGMTEPIKDSSRSIAYPNNCSKATDTTGTQNLYNYSDGYCHNTSGGSVSLAALYQLPLSGLFDTSGAVVLAIVAAFLIAIIYFTLRYVKK